MTDGAATLPPVGAGLETSRSGEISCPHCGGANLRKPSPGAIVDCVHCDRSFGQPRPPALSGSNRPKSFDPILARSPTDVGMRVTGAAAVVVAVFFYLAIVQPLAGTYFGELFGARGWVPYAITWLSAWAGLLLIVKAWLLSSQRRALELDLLPDAIDARITPGNADVFQQHLRDVSARELPRSGLPVAGGIALAASRSFLVERIDRALDRFRMRSNSQDVVDQLTSQSQLDANAVESSYTMIRVFIWAIPLLGFIGTVVGISAAVAGFSDSVASAVDLDVMKHSIGTVTTGLGVAFDTTLLALVMSILIMFPTSSLQKAEEDFLGRVDAYCDERLGRRVDDGASEPVEPGGLPGGLPGIGALQDQISLLARSIEALGAKLGAHR
jgi:biopolymer transport protein ExbB/TolQ